MAEQKAAGRRSAGGQSSGDAWSREVGGPAFYASPGGGWRDWWLVLHPPYTAWHLSYVVIGAAVASRLSWSNLVATLLAFFLAVGVAAHALDEWNGRPLDTHIPGRLLLLASAIGLGGALALGVVGISRVGLWLLAFMFVGTFLVLAYDLELMGARLHTDAGFAAAWGAFPVLTSYFAQTGRISWTAVVVAASAFGLSLTQRTLSTPARMLRRRATAVSGEVVLRDGSTVRLDHRALLGPLEGALKALSWSLVALALGLALYRFTA